MIDPYSMERRRRESGLEDRLRDALVRGSPVLRNEELHKLLQENYYACDVGDVDAVVTEAESTDRRVEHALVDAFPVTDLFRVRAAYDLHRLPSEVTQDQRHYAKIAYFTHFFSQPFIRHVDLHVCLDVGVWAVEAKYDAPLAVVLFRKDSQLLEEEPFHALYNVELKRFVTVLPFTVTESTVTALSAAIDAQQRLPRQARRTGWQRLRDA